LWLAPTVLVDNRKKEKKKKVKEKGGVTDTEDRHLNKEVTWLIDCTCRL